MIGRTLAARHCHCRQRSHQDGSRLQGAHDSVHCLLHEFGSLSRPGLEVRDRKRLPLHLGIEAAAEVALDIGSGWVGQYVLDPGAAFEVDDAELPNASGGEGGRSG